MRGVLLGVILAAGAAYGQSPDWTTVQQLHHNDTLIVESSGTFTRCRLFAVDAATLSCREDGWRKPRVVYPAAQVQSVYHVHLKGTEKAKGAIGAGALLFLTVGIATSNVPIFAVGFLGAVISLSIVMSEAQDSFWRWLTGAPPEGAFKRTERQDLIYARSAS